MAKIKLKAEFFCYPNGDVFKKEPLINFNLRKYIFERDNYQCQKCSDEVGLFRSNFCPISSEYKRTGHVHHILKRSRGGLNHIHNLILLCEKCHNLVEGLI